MQAYQLVLFVNDDIPDGVHNSIFRFYSLRTFCGNAGMSRSLSCIKLIKLILLKPIAFVRGILSLYPWNEDELWDNFGEGT